MVRVNQIPYYWGGGGGFVQGLALDSQHLFQPNYSHSLVLSNTTRQSGPLVCAFVWVPGILVLVDNIGRESVFFLSAIFNARRHTDRSWLLIFYVDEVMFGLWAWWCEVTECGEALWWNLGGEEL